jgi:hypothetical protein
VLNPPKVATQCTSEDNRVEAQEHVIKNRLKYFLSVAALALVGACTTSRTEEKVLLVAPQLYNAPVTTQLTPVQVCSQDCLEYRIDPSDAPTYLFKSAIEGFIFEAGYNYKLRTRFTYNNGVSIASTSIQLLETLEKIKAQ